MCNATIRGEVLSSVANRLLGVQSPINVNGRSGRVKKNTRREGGLVSAGCKLEAFGYSRTLVKWTRILYAVEALKSSF